MGIEENEEKEGEKKVNGINWNKRQRKRETNTTINV